MAKGRRLWLRVYLVFLAGMVGLAVVSGFVTAAAHRRPPATLGGVRNIVDRVMERFCASAGVALEDRAALEQLTKSFAADYGLDVMIVGKDGTTLARAGGAFQAPQSWPTEARKSTAFAPGEQPFLFGQIRRTNQSEPSAMTFVQLPRWRRPPWPIRPLVTLVLALAVALLLAVPLSRSITRPLERLTAAAGAFGRGDFSVRSGLPGGDEVGQLAHAFDEMAARLQTARRSEKELLANVSHELRTPLTRIRLALELLEPATPTDAPTTLSEIRHRLLSISEDISQLEHLVADVLAASRLDLAEIPLTLSRVNLAELANRSRQRALQFSPGRLIEVAIPSALEAQADQALLARALDNLVDNALKYAETSRPVRIEGRSEGGRIWIAVTDGGPGIPPEDLQRVFEPFFRGGATRGKAGGFGLGLALARRVAEAHGGRITAMSAPNAGTRIEIDLPSERLESVTAATES